MDIQLILEKERGNKKSIYLYLQGKEWKAYEASAKLISGYMPSIEVVRLPSGIVTATVPFERTICQFDKQVARVADDYVEIRFL